MNNSYEGESKTNQFFLGVSVQSLITIGRGVLEIVFFSLWSRFLGRAEFGYFATLTAIIVLVDGISQAGLGATIIQKQNSSTRFVSTTFSLSILIGLVFTIVIYFSAGTIASTISDDTIVVPLKWMSLLLLINSVNSIGSSLLIKNLQFLKNGIISITAYVVASIIGLILAFNGYGLTSIVVFSILTAIINMILLYTIGVKLPRMAIYKEEIKGIISYGGWLTLGDFVNLLSRQIDKLVLSKWLSVEMLGAYNRPSGFINQITSKVTGVVDTVLFPILSDLQSHREKVQLILIRSISLLNSFSIVLAAIFFFNSKLIILIFFGQEWLDLIPVTQIVSLGVVFSVDGILVDCFFRSLNYLKTNFVLRLIQLIVMVGGIIWGVRYGIIGVAWGIVVANIFIIIVKVTILTVKVNVPIRALYRNWLISWKPVFPLLVIGIPFVLIQHSVLFDIVFALIFGLIIIWEFAINPRMVSDEYVNTVYPKVEQLKLKIFSNNSRRSRYN